MRLPTPFRPYFRSCLRHKLLRKQLLHAIEHPGMMLASLPLRPAAEAGIDALDACLRGATIDRRRPRRSVNLRARPRTAGCAQILQRLLQRAMQSDLVYRARES